MNHGRKDPLVDVKQTLSQAFQGSSRLSWPTATSSLGVQAALRQLRQWPRSRGRNFGNPCAKTAKIVELPRDDHGHEKCGQIKRADRKEHIYTHRHVDKHMYTCMHV